MTAQISDEITYNGEQYTLAAVSELIKFDPREYGFKPSSASTACRQGFWCEYAVEGGALLMKRLHIHTEDEVYPEFNGASPVLPPAIDRDAKVIQVTTYDSLMGTVTYEADMPMHYNGRMMLGRGFISEYFMNIGFPATLGFRDLLELVFEDGILQQVSDRSGDAALLRKAREKCWWFHSGTSQEQKILMDLIRELLNREKTLLSRKTVAELVK